MDPLCLSAARLVLLSILVAGAQGSDTRAPSQSRPMFCLEPPFHGPGEAHIPRFFFNTRSGLCESFVFGGGGAKLNNFLSKEECTRVCSGRGPALQARYKRDLEGQPEPEDEVEDEIVDTLEHKIEDRDADENPEGDDEVDDETEIEIEYMKNYEGMDEDFENNGEDKHEDNLYEDDLQVKIEYGAEY